MLISIIISYIEHFYHLQYLMNPLFTNKKIGAREKVQEGTGFCYPLAVPLATQINVFSLSFFSVVQIWDLNGILAYQGMHTA